MATTIVSGLVLNRPIFNIWVRLIKDFERNVHHFERK